MVADWCSYIAGPQPDRVHRNCPLLGTVGFGELGVIQSTVGMFGVFAGLGLGMTATKYVASTAAQILKKQAASSACLLWLP